MNQKQDQNSKEAESSMQTLGHQPPRLGQGSDFLGDEGQAEAEEAEKASQSEKKPETKEN